MAGADLFVGRFSAEGSLVVVTLRRMEGLFQLGKKKKKKKKKKKMMWQSAIGVRVLLLFVE